MLSYQIQLKKNKLAMSIFFKLLTEIFFEKFSIVSFHVLYVNIIYFPVGVGIICDRMQYFLNVTFENSQISRELLFNGTSIYKTILLKYCHINLLSIYLCATNIFQEEVKLYTNASMLI